MIWMGGELAISADLHCQIGENAMGSAEMVSSHTITLILMFRLRFNGFTTIYNFVYVSYVYYVLQYCSLCL